MPFDKPTRTGGDYLDLRKETEKGPRLLAFRILDLDLPPEDGDFRDSVTGEYKKVHPVAADVMVIDGPNAGVIYRGKTYKYAITNALRGASQDDPDYTTHPGQEIAVRAERSKKKGVSTNTVWGNEPSDAELEEIERVFAEWGGWQGGRKPEDVAAAANGERTAGPQPAHRRPRSGGQAHPARQPRAAPHGAHGARAGRGSAPRRPFGRKT